jgi:two-component system, LytTR family, sensor kinase
MSATSVLKPLPSAPPGSTHLLLRIFAVLTLIAVVTVIQANYFLDNSTGSVHDLIRFFISKIAYYWYFLGLAVVVKKLAQKIPFVRSSVGRWGVTHFAVMTASFFLHQMLTLGIDRLVWGNTQKGSFAYLLFNNPAIWMEVLGYGTLLLVFSLNELQRVNDEKELRCSALEAQLMEARYEELRARLHPDFLFDTLDTMATLIMHDRHRAANTLLGLFSDFLRTTVYDRDQEERPLKNEIAFLKQYLAIENIRTEGALSIHEQVDDEGLNAMIPSFILQPLAEEFLRCTSDSPGGSRAIEICIRSSSPTITMEMTGRDRTEGLRRTVPSFDRLRDRLGQLYGARYQIHTNQCDDRIGVTLSLPIARRVAQEAASGHPEDLHE